MLTGKAKTLYDLLSENMGEWVSVRDCVVALWGPSSFDTSDEESKRRKHLSGYVSYMKSGLENNYMVEKSKSLDAVKLMDESIPKFKSLQQCVSCNSYILNQKVDSECLYCVNCLCSMMEDLGI